MKSRLLQVFLGLVVSFAVSVRTAAAGQLLSSSTSEDGTHITVRWTFNEWAGHEVGYPQWVGYDVLRRPALGCGAWVRVNPEIFPRTVGATHSHTWVDTPPQLDVGYEYRVSTVDANREVVILDYDFACQMCAYNSWASAPNLSAPLAVGKLVDRGWSLDVVPCVGSCSPAPYIEAGGESFEALRAYAGTTTTLRFFGRVYCGTIEGCGMAVDHYDVAPCDAPVQVRSTAWGSLKLIYR
jgi:hypothetical protein